MDKTKIAPTHKQKNTNTSKFEPKKNFRFHRSVAWLELSSSSRRISFFDHAATPGRDHIIYQCKVLGIFMLVLSFHFRYGNTKFL